MAAALPLRERTDPPRRRARVLRGTGARALVVLLDGTMSSLAPGRETSIGLIWKLLSDLPWDARPEVYYEAGIQWDDWRDGLDVAQGVGLNRQIMRAYGWLASRYRPGDRIYLLGYSRGAFAVRSLAGVIDRIGLLRPRCATERMVRQVYRHYRIDPHGRHAQACARRLCQPEVEIEMVGAFDTVKALGLRLPLLWRLTEGAHAFHSTHLGRKVRHGYQALALDERRRAFEPVLWECPAGIEGDMEQMWFRGTHGDVGGQLMGVAEARPLANIPLVWMLEKAQARGLTLPGDWRARFPCDPAAPSAGSWRGWGKAFLIRGRRMVGRDGSERLHPTAGTAVGGAAADLPLDGRTA